MPRRHRRVVAGLDVHVDDDRLAALDAPHRVVRAPPAASSGALTGPMPSRPCARASIARSGAGSSMRWPIQRFSTGRPAALATRSWCTSSLKNERLLQTMTSSGHVARSPRSRARVTPIRKSPSPRIDDGQPRRALAAQCAAADGDARSRADAAAAVVADEVERMAEVPHVAGPSERQMQQANVVAAQRVLQRGRPPCRC